MKLDLKDLPIETMLLLHEALKGESLRFQCEVNAWKASEREGRAGLSKVGWACLNEPRQAVGLQYQKLTDYLLKNHRDRFAKYIVNGL